MTYDDAERTVPFKSAAGYIHARHGETARNTIIVELGGRLYLEETAWC